MRLMTAFLVVVGVFALSTMHSGAIFAESTDTAVAPDSKDLIILPAGVTMPDVVEINTGEKEKLADGSYNDKYIAHKPGDGELLVSMKLHVATKEAEPQVSIPLEDFKLTAAADKDGDAEAYVPFAIFLAPDWREANPDSPVIVNGKEAVELAFEVPAEACDNMSLMVGDQNVGTLAELRKRSDMREKIHDDDTKSK